MRRFILLFAVSALVATSVPNAVADPVPGVAVVSSVAFTFYPGDIEQPNAPLQILQGWTLVFVNADPLAAHSFVSDKKDRRGRRIFTSGEPTGLGNYAMVSGIERLKPGTYGFHCGLHTSQMKGVLTVVAPPV